MLNNVKNRRVTMFAGAILTVQVPRYAPVSTEVRAITPPRAQGLGPEAFGAGLGAGIQQVAGVALQVLNQEQEKANVAAIADIKTKSAELTSQLLYDPNEGALTKRGSDAFGTREKPGILDTTLGKYDEGMRKHIDALPNPVQKETATRLYNQERVGIEKDLLRHVISEKEADYNATFKASLETAHNNIGRYYQETDRVQQEIRFGEGLILAAAKIKGYSPERVQELVQRWHSQAHQTVVEQMLVKSPVAARDYLEANREGILPDQQRDLDRTLRPLAAAQAGNDAAREIVGENPGVTIDALMTKARDRFKADPEALRHAETEIRSMVSEREMARKQSIEEARNEVYGYLANVQLTGKIPKRSDVPAEAWARLAKVDARAVDEITDEIRREIEHATDRTRQEQDRRETKATANQVTTWGMLKLDPNTLRNTNLDALLVKGKITKSHYQDLIGDQLAIKQGKGEHEAKLLSDKAAVDNILASAGIKARSHPERYTQFYYVLNNEVKVFTAENGRKPKQEDVINLARGLLAKVSQDVNLWPIDKTVRVFEANPGKVRVPAADRVAIKKKLAERGLPVTEETVRKIYLKRIGVSSKSNTPNAAVTSFSQDVGGIEGSPDDTKTNYEVGRNELFFKEGALGALNEYWVRYKDN